MFDKFFKSDNNKVNGSHVVPLMPISAARDTKCTGQDHMDLFMEDDDTGGFEPEPSTVGFKPEPGIRNAEKLISSSKT